MTNASPPTFAALGLSPASLTALAHAGYHHPTPIQAQCIPPALEGRDVIGCAATGTGKTAAFMLPLVERLTNPTGPGIRALVLAPTRELALQIAEHATRFGGPHHLHVSTVIGGTGMGAQLSSLKRAHICIATPGRLVDHLQQGSADLSRITVLVLDEADRMLDMGFRPQLTRILARVPRVRQTLLFSATMAGEVATFAKAHSRDPVRVAVTRSGTTAERATQVCYEVTEAEKAPLLLSLLAERDESTLVFTRTKRRADRVAKVLLRAGHAVERLHADRSQAQRKRALDGFKSGEFSVLVATDIAARGIDVADIGHVINFDLPHVPEDYVHRVGRTARNQASGHASCFCAPDEAPLLRGIEALIRLKVPRGQVPHEDPIFTSALAEARAHAHAPAPGGRPHGTSNHPPRHSGRKQSPGRGQGSSSGSSSGAQSSGGHSHSSHGGARKSGTVVFSGGPRRRSR